MIGMKVREAIGCLMSASIKRFAARFGARKMWAFGQRGCCGKMYTHFGWFLRHMERKHGK